MAKFKLRTSPQTTTITHIINSPTVCRISWESEPSVIVNITNIGTNLPSSGYRDVTISASKTYIIDSINPTSGLTNQRVINFVYQPISQTTSTTTGGIPSLLYQNGTAILLQNGQEMTLQG